MVSNSKTSSYLERLKLTRETFPVQVKVRDIVYIGLYNQLGPDIVCKYGSFLAIGILFNRLELVVINRWDQFIN